MLYEIAQTKYIILSNMYAHSEHLDLMNRDHGHDWRITYCMLVNCTSQYGTNGRLLAKKSLNLFELV